MINGFPESMRVHDKCKIDYAVPSWHINGHEESCRRNFSEGYLKGAGQMCGEEVETSWSHTNPLAASIHEMGPAAHHKTLNDHWNGWNFRKVAGFGTVCYYLFASPLVTVVQAQHFDENSREQPT